MKRILYLSLLLVIPFFLQADHGRDRINGKWISSYFNKQIKVKVKRHEVKVKGLTRNGWTYFTPVRRNVFEDCDGNRIKINNIHDLVYINKYRDVRMQFVKKGHRHNNHNCNSNCAIGNDYFGHQGHNHGYYNNSYGDDYYDNSYGDDYYDEWEDDYRGNRNNRGNKSKGNRNRDQDFYSDGISGQYHVREIDEYITINRTRNGLKARRGKDKWVEYTQNRNRKNEYVDKRGNKYLIRSNGEITWKDQKGNVSLNLKK